MVLFSSIIQSTVIIILIQLQIKMGGIIQSIFGWLFRLIQLTMHEGEN